MQDTRAFLIAGFRKRITANTQPKRYKAICHTWIECSKGGPWLVTQDPATGKITKEKLKM